MYIATVRLTFHIPHSASLKDKRQVCRSLIDKAKHRFNASIAEVDTQDIHQTLTIGVAVVSGSATHAQQSLDEIIRYMERRVEIEFGAELIEVDYD